MTDTLELERRVAELERRLASVIRFGTIAEVDAGRPRARVSWAAESGTPALTGWLPWLATAAGQDRDWRPPSVGEQVALLAPGGELSAAWILPGAYRDDFPAPEAAAAKRATLYRDGALVEYDSEEHALKAVLPDGGTASVAAPGGLAIEGDTETDGNLSIGGDLSVTGDLDVVGRADVGGALEAKSVSDARGSLTEIRTVFDGHTHIIPGAPPTAVPAPVQKMS